MDSSVTYRVDVQITAPVYPTEIEARVAEAIQGTFEIIDGVEVCIEVPHPLGDATFGVIDLKDSAFAAEVREAFEKEWANARTVD